jgi:hypothetical protein
MDILNYPPLFLTTHSLRWLICVGVASQMLHEQHAIVDGKAYGCSYWLALIATAVRH